MWWDGSNTFIVYLGERVVGWTPFDSIPQSPANWLQGDTPGATFSQFFETVDKLGHKSRRVIDLRLSGSLASPFIFESVDGLKSAKDAMLLATEVAPEITGLARPCAVWLDEWTPGKACVAVAMSKELQVQLLKVSRKYKWNCRRMMPWWSVALEAAIARNQASSGLLAALDSDSLTVLTSDASGYVAATTHAPKPASAQARALITRCAIAANLRPEEVVWTTLGNMKLGSDAGVPEAALSIVPDLRVWP